MNKVQVVNRLPATYDAAAILSVMRQLQVTTNQLIDGYVHTTTAVSLSYTASLNDSIIVADPTSGSVTITLPRADEAKGKRFTVKKKDSGANTVTVQANSGNIDGAASQVISAPYASWDFVSDGTNYWIV